MTVDAVPRKGRRARTADAPRDVAIGEVDANIFDCPVCRRPLATGTRRCAGCGTRLLAGIRRTTAAGFVAVGLIAGLAIGATGAAVVVATTVVAPAPDAPAIVTPGAAPVASVPPATAPPVASAPAPAIDPTVPAAAVSALRQSALLNQRIVDDSARLVAALAVERPVPVDIARALRALASSAAFGDRIAPELADWPAGAEVSAALAEFYAAIGATAREGLSASLLNTDAYVSAGTTMLDVLDRLAAIDAAARDLAAGADLELPPLNGTTDGEGAAAP